MKQSDINTKTCLYGVLGDPVSHSLSPLMHNTAFDHIGYNGVYLAFGVKDLGSAVAGIRALGIKGASVTIPHKIKVMDYLDEIDEQALKIGAVNTIVNRNGHLFGYNSDCLGAIHALKEKTPIRDKHVVIAGAGGAARAIAFGILAEGGKLTILSQIKEEGEALAMDLGVDYYPLSEYLDHGCDIFINATPVGMTPHVDDMPVGPEYLKASMTVMDIVYNPLKTRLLDEAEKAGCKWVDGVSMFVYQGVSQFESWTGKKAPVDLMRQVVLSALA
ncbi:MAG: shikimate dehydrogenase [Proteobacteria bacterium]|nr:shikimate dehydrogenase [Pseudomonadota bacterium]